MKFKKFIVICSFLIVILLMASVSACDDSTSDILNASDESLHQNSQKTDSIDETRTGSFNELENEIKNTSTVLVLNKDYVSDNNHTHSININKTITIDGNGHIINGKNMSVIFNITAKNVTLKNIVFISTQTKKINIVTTDLEEKGIFYWNGINWTIINCTFLCRDFSENSGSFDDLTREINNAGNELVLNRDYVYSTDYYSTHIEWRYIYDADSFNNHVTILFPGHDEEGIIINKTITIDGRGHVLDGRELSRIFKVIGGRVIFKNIIFRCGSSDKGSAIYGKSLVINSTFEDNYCRNPLRVGPVQPSIYGYLPEPFYYIKCFGGAVYDVNATNCTFRYNHADYGGAMYGGNAINCIFKDNYADYGGSLYEGNAINSSFMDNHADSGGAISSSKASNCVFKNNKANNNGGAAYNTFSYNCNFINNSASYGGGLYQSSCDSCIFINNTASINGGSICSYRHHNNISTGDKILNSIFINNSANCDGGAVWGLRDYALNSIICNSTFKNNNALENGGAVYGAIIFNSTFKNNTASNGGDVCESILSKASQADTYNSTLLTEENTKSFSDLDKLINSNNDSEIYLNDDYSFDLNYDFKYADVGICINRSVIIHGNNHIINGNHISRIFKVYGEVIFENINFMNGKTSGYGGAINGRCTVFNSTFKNNHAYEDGGALFNVTCFSSSFIENTAKYGGAVSCSNVTNSRFINNTASYGGAVYKGLISNSNFTLNSVYGYGGAIWHGEAINCIFKNNSAGYGGGIYECSAINSKFISNLAHYGGAIYRGDAINCVFINNSAYYHYSDVGGEGGALYAGSAFNSTFINNTALGNGGAIYIPWGGIEYVKTDEYLRYSLTTVAVPYIPTKIIYIPFNATIEKCYFENNTSNKNGGGVYSKENNTAIINSIFKNNNAEFGGDVYFDNESSRIINSILNSSNIDLNNILKLAEITGNKDLKIYYKSNKYFKVKIYDDNGKLAVNESVKFRIAKQVFNVKTDANGVASLEITQKPGKYSITSEYNGIKVKNIVIIKSRLITKNLTKKIKKTALFKVKVLNRDGKVYAKQTVKIKFNGKTYKMKTNSKGIASLKLNKKIKAGKYTIKTTYAGLTNVNKITVKK